MRTSERRSSGREPRGRGSPLGGTRSALRRRARIGVISALVAFAVWLVTAASASAFTAQGSAKQVYVTGLAPNAQVSLLNSSGATVYTQNADSLGGLLFRNVTPGSGYRVRLTSTGETSGPITVHSDAAAPWDPSIYNQAIPDNGYTYLTTRDGTQLAIDVHPPTQSGGRAGRAVEVPLPDLPAARCANAELHAAVSDADRVLGLRLREPGRPGKRHRRARQPDGLRRGRREHARDRLLGRRLRLLRTAAEPRRLRRDRDDRPPAVGARQQGRHARHLLRRHQPAVHRAAAAARPRGDRAAVGDRRDGDDALPGRHPQRRLRGGLGRTAPAERRTGRSRPRPGMGLQADPGRRPDLRGQPGPARRGGQPDGRRSKKTRPTTRRSPTRSTRSRSSTRSTCRRSWPASSRTSRPAVTAPIWPSTSPARAASGSRSPTAPTSTRSIRTRTTGCTTSWSCTSRTQAPIDNSAVVQAAAPVIYEEAMGLPEGDVVTLPPDPIQEQPTYESALAAFEALPAIRVLFDNGAGTSPTGSTTAGDPYPGFEQSFSEFPIPGTKAQTWYLGPGGTLNEQQPTAEGVDSYTSDANAVPLTDYSGQHRRGRSLGQRVRSGNGTGCSRRRAPPCPTCRRRSRPTRPPSAAGAVHLWVKSSTPDVDLQATVSEVRPDGNETFVQNGWMRASERKLATTLEQHLQAEADAAPADPDDARIRCATDAGGRIRPGRRSRSTSRGTPTARARASGSRSPRPTERSRSGRSATRSRRAPPRRSRSPSRRACRRA